MVAREIRHGTRENQLQCLGEVLHGELADAALEGLVLFGVGLLPGVEFLEHRGHRQRRVTRLDEQVEAQQVGLGFLAPTPDGQHQLLRQLGGEDRPAHRLGVGFRCDVHLLDLVLYRDSGLLQGLEPLLHVVDHVGAVVVQQHMRGFVRDNRGQFILAVHRAQPLHRDIDVAIGRGQGFRRGIGENHDFSRHAVDATGLEDPLVDVGELRLEFALAHVAKARDHVAVRDPCRHQSPSPRAGSYPGPTVRRAGRRCRAWRRASSPAQRRLQCWWRLHPLRPGQRPGW